MSLVIIFGVAFVVVLYVAISLLFVIYIRRSVALICSILFELIMLLPPRCK